VLAELARRVPVWVELGLEAADDRVLAEIRRFHTVADFEDAVLRARAAGLGVVGHAILGLPGDGRHGARRTAEVLARSGVDGVKLHNLLVLRRTQLERAWRAGALAVPDLATHVDWLADVVERLAPEQVLHRLTADAPDGEELAPRWGAVKNEVRARLAAELLRRGTRQGSRLALPA
jgi:radical SAM protein (TIGR01212 family)